MRVGTLIYSVVLCLLAACGGSSDSGGTNPPPPAAVSSVSLDKTTVLLKPSETTTITATPKDANGGALTGHTVTWSVSPSTGIAAIAPNGSSVTVTANANGSATVTATVESKTADAHITVTNSLPTTASVTVGAGGQDLFDPSSVDIAAGGTVTFTWAGVTHNVTWLSPPAPVSDIPNKSSGSASVTLSQPGTYNYHCTIHPGMSGVVTVH